MTAPTDTIEDRVVRLRWWREVGLILGFYLVYSYVRNQFGSAAVSPSTAYDNAVKIIDIEKAIGLYQESRIQSWFIDSTAFIQFWNLFYGTFHFAVTVAVFVFLYRRRPRIYPFWRTAFLATTGLALVGFAVFPLMPPRLLADCSEYGACVASGPFVDTVKDIGGLWSFDSGTAQKVSNQYAAMPSLHFAWAMWSALAMASHVRSPAARWLNASYPLFTLFAIIVTANHFWIDALGGVVVLAAGLLFATWLHGRVDRLAPAPTTVTQ